MRFSIVNLGCKVNRVESDQICAALRRAGTEADVEDADMVIVNTCTVTGEADRKTRKTLRRLLRNNAGCEVVVTGCASAIDPGFFSGLSERIHVVPKHEAAAYAMRLADSISKEASVRGEALEAADEDDVPVQDDLSGILRYGDRFNTRVGIKVQDGCDNACTYCIVHIARGKARSIPLDRIVGECEALARLGVKEMVLTGINLGSYRHSDTSRAYALHDLLSALLDATASAAPDAIPCRFRLSSIEPDDLSPQVIEMLAASDGRICRHLHLPVQSGSSSVLHDMARRYSAEDYMELISLLRKKVPRISVTTDAIAGFPGETEADFQATMKLARECGFSKIHVFPYSRRNGTPAAARSDQVPADVKNDRARRLRKLSDELRYADYCGRAGSVEKAVVESCGACMSESYYELPCETGIPRGSLIDIEVPPIAEMRRSALIGKCASE